jgi:nicotinamide-nucleotide amidase
MSNPVVSEIITVGDEILRGDIVNSNAAYIGRAFAALGIPPRFATVVPDTREAIHSAIQCALSRAHVIALTGGLGPTPDDLTRDAVADFFGMKLEEDPEWLEHVKALFRSRGSEMPPTSRNQGLFPVGAKRIPNPYGTAAGIHIESNGRHLFALPGVPVEMQQMTDEYIVPALRAAFPDALALTKTLRLAGIGESQLLLELGDQSEIQSRVWVAYLPHHGLLDVRLTALSRERPEAEAQIAYVEAVIRERVGEHLYAVGNSSIAEVIGNVLVNRGQKLATAESCTGGLLANMLTDTPGSSRWFDRGFVTYSNEAKIHNLNVPPQAVEQHGAVSEDVARAMAEGACRVSGADWGIAATGIAGPDGGTEQKPVGTVWVAVASKQNTTARLLNLSGLRQTIKLRTAHFLLYLLYRELMETRHP